MASNLPWASRIWWVKERQPNSMAELWHYKPETKADQLHISFLAFLQDSLHLNWREEWLEVLAIGPFLGRKRRHSSIPVLFIGSSLDRYEALLSITESLVSAYLGTGILPAVHVMSPEHRYQLEESSDSIWTKTLAASIRFLDSK